MAKKNAPLIYPWASLYDIESGVRKLNVPSASPGPGRPTNPVNRMHTSITLTDEEKRIFDKLAYQLGAKLHPNKVTRSQVLGLALRLLDAQLESLPRSLDSWETLAAVLFGTEADSGEN